MNDDRPVDARGSGAGEIPPLRFVDSEGRECSLDVFVRREPGWAASRIRHMNEQIQAKDAELAALRQELEAERARRADDAARSERIAAMGLMYFQESDRRAGEIAAKDAEIADLRRARDDAQAALFRATEHASRLVRGLGCEPQPTLPWMIDQLDNAIAGLRAERDSRAEQVDELHQVIDRITVALGSLGLMQSELPGAVAKLRADRDRLLAEREDQKPYQPKAVDYISGQSEPVHVDRGHQPKERCIARRKPAECAEKHDNAEAEPSADDALTEWHYEVGMGSTYVSHHVLKDLVVTVLVDCGNDRNVCATGATREESIRNALAEWAKLEPRWDPDDGLSSALERLHAYAKWKRPGCGLIEGSQARALLAELDSLRRRLRAAEIAERGQAGEVGGNG